MKNYDYRKISIDLSYGIPEIMQLFGVSERTIYNWISKGLSPIEPGRVPTLFDAKTLKEFLRQKRRPRGKPMKNYETYCPRCKKPRRSKEKSIRVVGKIKHSICSVCGGKMCRTISSSERTKLCQLNQLIFHNKE